jgi:hypothetical protein
MSAGEQDLRAGNKPGLTPQRFISRLETPMARSRKGTPHQSKHFQPEDHAHAAHQQEASRRSMKKPDRYIEANAKEQMQPAGHPTEITPRGPRKGQ